MKIDKECYMENENYIETVKHIKAEIIRSRYFIAKVANRELLSLYFKVGFTIKKKITEEKWGSKTIERLSIDLQNEMQGLRGFSSTNLKRMKQFYEEWSPYIQQNVLVNEISPLLTDQLNNNELKKNPLLTDGFIENFISIFYSKLRKNI
jgi:hypothetical protein